VSELEHDIESIGDEGAGVAAAPTPPRGWRELWQVPTLILALGLLAGGLVTAMRTAPPPDYQGRLDAAASMIESGQYVEAIDHLNSSVHPAMARGALEPELESRFHLLMGRALSRGQAALGINEHENHESIVSSYLRAERLGSEFTGPDRAALAMSLVSTGELREAVDRARPLVETDRRAWTRVYREAIERSMGDASGVGLASELLGSYLAEPGLDTGERAWAAAQQADLMMAQGFTDEAITRLLREIQRLRDAPSEELATLFLMLARGYDRTGAVGQVSEQLTRVESLIEPSDPRIAEVWLMRGRLAAGRGESERAVELFTQVTESYSHTSEHLPALLELAEAEASMGRTSAALDAYRRLAVELDAGRTHRDADLEALAASVLERAGEQRQRGELRASLAFSDLAWTIHDGGVRPPGVMWSLASSHRALADDLLGQADPDAAEGRRLSRLDPSTREQARRHLVAAGSVFRQHADTVAQVDTDAYERSLWLAAESFDLAGDLGEAIAAYQEYVAGFPGQARRAEARYRLGRAYQARGETDLAAAQYQSLIEDRNDPEIKNVGLFADMSVVPLAQVYSRDDDPANDGEAERLLRLITEGEIVVQPDTPLMREALIELGRLLASSGRDAEAVAQFETMLARFPEDPRTPIVRYRLAESLRHQAETLGERLDGDQPSSVRARLVDQRRDRLERALELYDRVVREIESVAAGRRTALEREVLRNAYFFRGGVAYDLGQYELAIRHYNTAFERHSDDPGALVSLVQIVNAYIEMGDLERARVANERAERFFSSLPDEVWSRPDLPMDRGDWERWLDSTTRLYSLGGEP